MKLFKFTSKDKNGNREMQKQPGIDGIPNLFKLPGEMCDVTINQETRKLTVKSVFAKDREASLDLDKIIDARIMTERNLNQ